VASGRECGIELGKGPSRGEIFPRKLTNERKPSRATREEQPVCDQRLRFCDERGGVTPRWPERLTFSLRPNPVERMNPGVIETVPTAHSSSALHPPDDRRRLAGPVLSQCRRWAGAASQNFAHGRNLLAVKSVSPCLWDTDLITPDESCD